MNLQFDWDRLDVTAAEALKELLNAKIEERLANHAALSSGTDAPAGNGFSQIESFRVTGIEWGITPPFVEIVELDGAQDFSGTSSASNDPLLGRQEASSLLTPFHMTSSLSSHYGCECASESDSLVGGDASLQPPKRSLTQWTNTSFGAINAPVSPAKDALASFLGVGGLYICLHITYGGPMRISLSSVLRHDIQFGPIVLPVRMPLSLFVSNMDMDFYLSINLHHNKCRIWIEPGKLSTSPITRMNIKAVFGERQMTQSRFFGFSQGIPLEEDNLDISDAWTHIGSSQLGSDEEDDGLFTEETVISQFVLSEIRAILQEKIVYPHFLEFPLFS